MKVTVKVKTGAKQNSVEKLAEGLYEIRVKQQPIEGKANQAAQKLLADYFGVAKNNVELFRGTKSKIKIFKIIK